MSATPANPFAGDMQRLSASVGRFLGEPASPRPLAALRIGISTVLLAQGLSLAANFYDLYGSQGIVRWAVTDGVVGGSVPRIGWLAGLLGGFGVEEATTVRLVLTAYMSSLAALLLGYRTRVAAVVAWLTHLMMNTSAVATIYGVDSFANIMLFYCTWMPVGAAWSLDVSAGRAQDAPSSEARLALRVLQIHLCLVYLCSGVEKAMGPDWWNGEAIWCSLMRRDLCSMDMSWMADRPLVPMLAGWGTLAVEIGYAALVWPRRTWRLTAAVTISMHLGIAIFMGLYSFAAMMSVLTFSAFFVSDLPAAMSSKAAAGAKNALGKLLALAG